MQVQGVREVKHSCVPDKLPGKVQERLLVVVVALCRNLMVLQILLPVESYLLGLHLAVLHIDLVTAEHNRDIFAHTAGRENKQGSTGGGGASGNCNTMSNAGEPFLPD